MQLHHLYSISGSCSGRATTLLPSTLRNSSARMTGQVDHRAMTTAPVTNGDLNNVSAMRLTKAPRRNIAFAYHSLAIPRKEDDASIRQKYRPFILEDSITSSDWISKVELARVTEMSHKNMLYTGERLRVLVLYGSLRSR